MSIQRIGSNAVLSSFNLKQAGAMLNARCILGAFSPRASHISNQNAVIQAVHRLRAIAYCWRKPAGNRRL